jgi:RNA polymerase sigma-70 factor (ECF subfamily)
MYKKESANEDILFCQFRDEGNKDSFEKLYRLVRPWLYKIILTLLGNHRDTEDIMHNTWIKVIENAHQFDPAKGRFINFIFSACKNQTLYWKSYKRKLKNFDSKFYFEYDYYYNKFQLPSNRLEIEQQSETIIKVLKKLPSDQQDCILLYYIANKPINEISNMLSMPEGQVKSLLARGREKLRILLSLNKYSDLLLMFSFIY